MNEIFDNQQERMENVRESAKTLGVDAQEQKPKEYYVASSKCKKCWGKGAVLFQAPKQEEPQWVFCSCVKVMKLNA